MAANDSGVLRQYEYGIVDSGFVSRICKDFNEYYVSVLCWIPFAWLSEHKEITLVSFWNLWLLYS